MEEGRKRNRREEDSAHFPDNSPMFRSSFRQSNSPKTSGSSGISASPSRFSSSPRSQYSHQQQPQQPQQQPQQQQRSQQPQPAQHNYDQSPPNQNLFEGLDDIANYSFTSYATPPRNENTHDNAAITSNNNDNCNDENNHEDNRSNKNFQQNTIDVNNTNENINNNITLRTKYNNNKATGVNFSNVILYFNFLFDYI